MLTIYCGFSSGRHYIKTYKYYIRSIQLHYNRHQSSNYLARIDVFLSYMTVIRHVCVLHSWYSECDPSVRNISIFWELVGNSMSQVQPRCSELKTEFPQDIQVAWMHIKACKVLRACVLSRFNSLRSHKL